MNLKLILIGTLISLTINMTSAQENDALLVVQKNLEAYNKRDIASFMSYFSEDIKMYDFVSGEITAKGLKEVRVLYEKYFRESPQLHSKIMQRIVFDNKVIDHEYITGARGRAEPLELILIYEVENGKIVKTTSIRKQP